MKFLDLGYALGCVAAALLAGCGGSQPPIGATGAMPQTSAIAMRADRGKSWMLPEAKSEDLLYVTTLEDPKVYSYPEGKHVGTVRGFDYYVAGGECADKAGDVFISTGKTFREYKHGGMRPIQTLTQSGYNALACASDPTTGNLAVTWAAYTTEFIGYLAVYPNASGTPMLYSLSGMVPEYCGYDDKSNLFCDGETNYGDVFRFAELAKGGKALRSASLSQSIVYGSSVQWDGKYLTVQDSEVNKIYRFAMSGSNGTLKGTVNLELVGTQYNLGGTLIIGNKVLGTCIAIVDSTQPYGNVNYYNYPEGGSPIKTISVGDDTAPTSVAVSVAPH
jgi:hypothetical protein